MLIPPPPPLEFQVDENNGPLFLSLSTGEWIDASKAATTEWDLAFERTRKIYTNSGASAKHFGAKGQGGVWYTEKTDFDAVTSKDDAVTKLSDLLAPYVTDQDRYTGTSKGYASRINLMTYMGYVNESTAKGTTADDFLIYTSGEGASYLPTAFYDIDWNETGQVYIIRHADGKTYSKFQVADFEFISKSKAPSGLSTDSYKVVRYQVFK
jgi:hypothetical protein